MCTILLSVASSTALVQTSQKRPQIQALFDSWSGSIPPLFPSALPQRLRALVDAVSVELRVKAQMPVASWTTGICRNTMLFT